MGYPRLVVPLREEFCAGLAIRLLFTGLIIQLLRRHFGQVDTIEDDRLAQTNTEFLWTADRGSALLIESVTNFDPRSADKRPALVVVPGAQQPQTIGIDNRYMGSPALDGSTSYTRTWQGSHAVMCLAGTGGEAELMAPEVNRELGQFAPIIRQELDLLRVGPAGIGPIGKLEEAEDHFAVPVGLAYAYRESWQVNPQCPLLRALRIELVG